jgi:hypothetical protein
MAQDSQIEEITHTIISNCCKKKNIYVCDEDIEHHCKKHENKEECVRKVKENLKALKLKFTTWD